VITIAAYDRHAEQITAVLTRLRDALAEARIEYRLVGGLAVFFHVHERDPLAARATCDLDIAVDRRDLDAIASAAPPRRPRVSPRRRRGDMLVVARDPKSRSAVHIVYVQEKVRPDYPEPVPGFSPPVRTREGVLLAPVEDLVPMKLTSFRLKDRVHIQDLDSVGLITPEIEERLPAELRRRLHEVRSAE